MPRLLLILLCLSSFAIAANNDAVVTQRPENGTGPNVTRLVTPTVGTIGIGWPASITDPKKITLGTGLSLTSLGVLSATSSSSGDVVGPASSVNNRIALFDGTTGKLLKDSGALLSDYLTTSTAASTYQPLDSDLTTWASITPSSAVQTLLGSFTKANLNTAVTDDNVAYVATDNAFTVAQTIMTTKQGGMNVTGSWPNLTNTAHWRNVLLTGNGDSALMQDEIGDTILNASTGAEIFFAINGGVKGKVIATGFNFSGGQGIGLNTLAPSACGIESLSGDDWYLRGGNMQFRSGDGSNRTPLEINTDSPGTVTARGILNADRIIAGSYQIGQDSSTPQIIFVGDSLTAGVAAANPYPFYCTIPTWNGFTLTQTNIGVSGYTFENIIDATHEDLNPQYAHHSGLNIAVVWAGSNDLLGYTAVEVYNRASEACRYLRRHGWKVIIATVISRGDAAFDIKKNDYNTLLTANWPAFADGLATLPTTIRGDGQYNDTTYFDSDKIHLNTTGQQQAAIGFDAAIDALIAAVGNVNYTDGDKGSVTVSSAGQTITYDNASLDLTTKVTGILPSANGGTGVNNAGTLTNASNTTITGGGTLALGGFTLTVPATGTAALLASANTFTAAQIIALGTITDPSTAQSITATWNDATDTFIASDTNITNTASAATSRLRRWRVGGTEVAAVNLAGGFLGTSSGSTHPAFGAAINTDFGIYFESSRLMIREGSTAMAGFGNGTATGIGLIMALNRAIGWAASSPDGTYDLQMNRMAAGRLGFGASLASGWIDQYIGPAGAIIGTTTNGSPTNEIYITNAISTGTGTASGSDIVFSTYGSNGSSGTAIGSLTERYKITGDGKHIITSPAAPASASDTGTVGEVRFDADYIYRCTATNTWKRAALSTW